MSKAFSISKIFSHMSNYMRGGILMLATVEYHGIQVV